MSENAYVKHIRRRVVEFNLFKTAESNDQHVSYERIATRLYLLSLIIVMCSVGIVTGFTVRTINKTEYWPTQITFEQLLIKYPLTLKCPCSRTEILYETFANVNAEFHQVCSSQFITQDWIETTNDIHVQLSTFWQVISAFCNISKQAWMEVLSNFDGSKLRDSNAANQQLVQTNVQSVLNSALTTTKSAYARNLFSIQRTMASNELVSGLATNFYANFTDHGIKFLPKMYNDCSCSQINGCPHSSFFINDQDKLISVPGIIEDCLIVDGALASTFECYYNDTCLSLLHGQIIVPLSSTLNKRFNSSSTVQILLNELMIDNFSIEISFTSFYSECKPKYCSYIFTRRFDYLFMFTTIIGTFGEFSLVLRFAAKILLKFLIYRKAKLTSTRTKRKSFHQIIVSIFQSIPKLIRQQIVSLNLFQSKPPHTPEILRRERITTRLFIVLLILSISAFGFYIFLPQQTQIITIEHPSIDVYKNLYEKYTTDLICPCSQISISHGKFLNITYTLHQICSSNMISSIWLNYMGLFDLNLQIPPNIWFAFDFRAIAPSYFKLLATLCSVIKTTIDDAYQTFLAAEYVKGYVIPAWIFTQEIDARIQSFIDSTQNDFTNTMSWISMANIDSQLITGANTNTIINLNNNNNSVIIDVPVYIFVTVNSETDIYMTGFCPCAGTSTACDVPSRIYLNASNCTVCQHYFNGVSVSCVPLSGLFKSKISWVYNQTLIDEIRSTYATSIQSNNSAPLLKSLDANIQTRFTMTKQWFDLINGMLLETWNINNSRFDLFYNECSPTSCSYTIEQRRSVIVALFILIAVVGTLNKAFRLCVPLVVNISFTVIRKWQHRNSIRAALPLANVRQSRFHSILAFNLYNSHSQDEVIQRNERIQTYVYVILVTIIMTVVILYTSFVERKKTVVQEITSYIEYEQLLALHSTNLQCLCTQIAIPYSVFITQLNVKYHPVCDSVFTTDSWIDYLAADEFKPKWLSKKDFRYWGASFFAHIITLCTLANDTMDNNLIQLRSSTIITEHVLSRIEFDNQTNITLYSMKVASAIAFYRTFELLRSLIQGNAFMSVLSSNWIFTKNETKQSSNLSLLTTIPVKYNNTNTNTECSCATSKLCSEQAQMFFPNLTAFYSVTGLQVGCFLSETIIHSSLSCFYSRNCLRTLFAALPLGGNDAHDAWAITIDEKYFQPIYAFSSRFISNETIDAIAQSMFIDSWTFNVSYELFFNTCAPNQCSITYYYRFDALEVFTTFLSVFNGITFVLRFIVPYFVRIFKNIYNRFCA